MRFRSGLLIGIFGLIVVSLGGWSFAIGITILTYLALLELFKMAENTGIKPATKTTLFSCVIIILSTYLEVNGIIGKEISNAILPISSIVICTWLLFQPKPGKISDIATSIFGLFYLGLLPSYWIRLRGLENLSNSSEYNGNLFSNLNYFSGFKITLMTCLLIVSSDIGSYFIGKKYGKRSLSLISPGKTIEGLIGGIICSILTGIIFSIIFNWDNSILIGISFGILVSLMGLVGDLIESMMKRDAKLKDSGNLLPGHGGMLDRIDSYIFTPSLVYYTIILLDSLKIF
ncbi:MAG: phosphatidate cytidylyltransferase [Prochlorococcus sp. SP3034]|nr:phosphatidate cytidylyltransferase [Prochlorococcus sp. SP3034]|tara:strand:+ start:4919 stop:5782 length:864 start_codon:yes stop_codon:yes gene_type:complete